MSVFEHRKRYESMTAENRRIYDLADTAVNNMGLACQMAEQGAVNSQCKHEEKSMAAMKELFDLLAPAQPKREIWE